MKRSNRQRHFLGRWVSQGLVAGPLAFLLVAGAGCPSLFESDSQRAVHVREAVVGRDGDRTIAASASGTIVNTYAALNAGVNSPSKVITVRQIEDAAFAASLVKGDLLLIIQMQMDLSQPTIDTTEGPTYGTVSAANLGNAGHYEFGAVESVTANSITLACGLHNSYAGPSGKTQVIRVPQYRTLTIDAGGFITAPAWDGRIGGVVAVHAERTLQLNGRIDVTGLGFRGGATHYNNTLYPLTEARYGTTDAAAGAEKGESIAGYEGEILGGRYGRGAPANGGGGGDAHNAGGGGGANAHPAAGGTWTGQGVMLSTVTGAAAWELDPAYIANGNALTTSIGGGRGGYSFSNLNLNALNVGPGNTVTPWDGDNRRNVGGLGGHALDNSPSVRLFMGGGGGAGDGNNYAAGSITTVVAGKGGNGGGIVFVIAGAISGSGRIVANGAAGGSTSNAANTASDAAGGGGGGGAILVHSVSASNITITADGGPGGSQSASMATEAEGPGGGGGGGYVAVSGTLTSVTRTAVGAAAGTTRTDGPLSEFPSNGATAGSLGDTSGDASTFLYCGMDPNNITLRVTIDTHPDDPSGNPRGTFTFSATEGAVTFECAVDGTANADWSPCTSPFTTGVLPDGDHTFYVRGTDLSGNRATANYPWAIVAGVLDAGVFHTTIVSGPAKVSGHPMGTFTFTNNHPPVTYQCAIDSTSAAAWTDCSSPYTTPLLADGDHTFYVRATDVNGTVEAPPASYPWAIVAGVLDAGVFRTTIVSGPDQVSGSPVGTFTFTNNHPPVTYQCAIDSTSAGAWTDCSSPFTTPVLPDGDHTFYVRATDVNGTTEAPPVTYPWKIIAGLLDGGVLDSGSEAGPIVDAQPDEATPDASSDVNTEKADTTIVIADTRPPSVDVGPDGRADSVVVLDAEPRLDGTVVLDVGDAERADTAAIPEPGPDAASAPEPGPDAALVKDDAAAKEDAAPFVKKDAAVTDEKPMLLGGGFCAVSSSRTSSSATFALLGLAALALLRRRRDGRR